MIRPRLIDTPTKYLRIMKEYPKFFFKTCGVNAWKKQGEIANSVRDNKHTAVISTPGSGKTHAAVWVAKWWINLHGPSKVIVSAPVKRQIKDLFWSEYRAAHQASEIELVEKLQLDTKAKIDEDWFLVGVTAKGDTASGSIKDKMTGYHSPNILVILDQADGLSRELWEAVWQLLTSKHARLLTLTNPWNSSSENANILIPEMQTDFGKKFLNEDGQVKPRKLEKPLPKLKFEGWNVIRITAFDLPNWKTKSDDEYPGLTSYTHIQECMDKWKESDPLYRMVLLAEYVSGAELTILTKEMVDWLFNKKNNVLPDWEDMKIGFDVARFGKDNSVNLNMAGGRLLSIKSVNGNSGPQVKRMTMRNADSLAEFARVEVKKIKPNIKQKLLEQIEVQQINADATGLGGPIADELREEGYPVVDIIAGGKVESEKESKRFKNQKARLSFHIRDLCELKALCLRPYFIGTDDKVWKKLKEECLKMRYKYTPDFKIIIEDKEAMRKILGRSPDVWDALVLAESRWTGIPTVFGLEEEEEEEKHMQEYFPEPQDIVDRLAEGTWGDLEASFVDEDEGY